MPSPFTKLRLAQDRPVPHGQWSRAIWPALFGITDPDEKWLERNTFPGGRRAGPPSLSACRTRVITRVPTPTAMM